MNKFLLIKIKVNQCVQGCTVEKKKENTKKKLKIIPKKNQKLMACDYEKEEMSMLEFMYALPWVGASSGKHLLLVVA